MLIESGVRIAVAPQPTADPLHTAIDPDLVRRELLAYGTAAVLVEAGPWQVFQIAGPLEHELHVELGRLRELTFRQVGEGTGRCIDVDPFDDHYTHLVCWNREQEAIAGAYRLVRTEDVRRSRGAQGLYTHTLFEFGEAFLDAIGPALELGRSFVVPEFQGTNALAMLWRGIGEWLAREPEIRALIGGASFDRRYDDETLALIVAALESHHAMPASTRIAVRPRTPFEVAVRPCEEEVAKLSSPAMLNRRVLERTCERGLPTLVKNYLLLGARVAAFNVDHDFADCVDALIVVERDRIDPRRLARFTGVSETDPRAA